jgi:hypothetical protein
MKYFECEFCLKKYVKEGSFKKHKCKLMARHKLMRTPVGAAAFKDYSTWLSELKYMNYGKDNFIESKVFISFVKFGEFSSKFALPNKKRFIQYMVDMQISPKDWSNKMVYEAYIKNYETLTSPEDQAAITVETIFELSRIYECEAQEIFIYMDPISLIRMIQAKKLSPWILLFSNKFMWFVKNEMTREQRIIMEKFVEVDSWNEIFDKHPDIVEKMKTYVKALNL